MAAPLTPTSLTFRGKQINGIDLETLTDANDKLPSNVVIYNELVEEGFIQSDTMASLTVEGTWTEYQIVDHNVDISGLSFLVTYDNYYHKHVDASQISYSPTTWGSTADVDVTITFSYTENGQTVTATKVGHTIAKSYSFTATDHGNPVGYPKVQLISNLSTAAFGNVRKYSSGEIMQGVLAGKDTAFVANFNSAPTVVRDHEGNGHFLEDWSDGLSSDISLTVTIPALYGAVNVTCANRNLVIINYYNRARGSRGKIISSGQTFGMNGRVYWTVAGTGVQYNILEAHGEGSDASTAYNVAFNFNGTIISLQRYDWAGSHYFDDTLLSIVCKGVSRIWGITDDNVQDLEHNNGGISIVWHPEDYITKAGIWRRGRTEDNPSCFNDYLDDFDYVIDATAYPTRAYIEYKNSTTKDLYGDSTVPASSWVNLKPLYHPSFSVSRNFENPVSASVSFTRYKSDDTYETVNITSGITSISFGGGSFTCTYGDNQTVTLSPDDWLSAYSISVTV